MLRPLHWDLSLDLVHWDLQHTPAVSFPSTKLTNVHGNDMQPLTHPNPYPSFGLFFNLLEH